LAEGCEDPFECLFVLDFRPPLPGEYPADRSVAAQAVSYRDHGCFPVYLSFTRLCIGLRKIRGTAEHGHGETCASNGIGHAIHFAIFK